MRFFIVKTDLKKLQSPNHQTSHEISLISQLKNMSKSYWISCKHHDYFSWHIGVNELNGNKIMIFRVVLNFNIINFPLFIMHLSLRVIFILMNIPKVLSCCRALSPFSPLGFRSLGRLRNLYSRLGSSWLVRFSRTVFLYT